jgi:hypothetical protein
MPLTMGSSVPASFSIPKFIVKQKNRTLSVAAQGMLELLEASLRSVGTRPRDIPGSRDTSAT